MAAQAKTQAEQAGPTRWQDQLDMVRGIIEADLGEKMSEDHWAHFWYVAQKMNLDPLARQIYAQLRDKKKKQPNGQWQVVGKSLTIITGIDGYRLIAMRAGDYCPGVITWEDAGEWPLSATASAWKLMPTGNGAVREWRKLERTVYFEEYKADVAMWRNMPHSQIGKCAEAQVLRVGWSDELSGVYTADEMHQADNQARSIPSQASARPVYDGDPGFAGSPAASKPSAEPRSQPQKEEETVASVEVRAVVQCAGTTVEGKPCKAKPFGSSEYCRTHDKARSEEVIKTVEKLAEYCRTHDKARPARRAKPEPEAQPATQPPGEEEWPPPITEDQASPGLVMDEPPALPLGEEPDQPVPAAEDDLEGKPTQGTRKAVAAMWTRTYPGTNVKIFTSEEVIKTVEKLATQQTEGVFQRVWAKLDTLAKQRISFNMAGGEGDAEAS